MSIFKYFIFWLLLLVVSPYKISAQINIKDTLIHNFIEIFCQDLSIKKINETSCKNDILDFLEIRKPDTLKYFLYESDYIYLKKQAINPYSSIFKQKYLKKIKVKKGSILSPCITLLSIPLFTQDLKTAIIKYQSCGLSRVYLYHRQNLNSRWILVCKLWQNGS
ncbi:hypothetical protein AD998_13900 [bacterium 336/3]|nr:hypothetical protein AD998_13900 [bacterium 336/3]